MNVKYTKLLVKSDLSRLFVIQCETCVFYPIFFSKNLLVSTLYVVQNIHSLFSMCQKLKLAMTGVSFDHGSIPKANGNKKTKRLQFWGDRPLLGGRVKMVKMK